MKPNTLDETFFGQVREAARVSRASSQRRLVGELLQAHQTISEYSYIILKLEAALKEIIESEEEQSVQSYGLGDIARSALELMRDACDGKLHSNREESEAPHGMKLSRVEIMDGKPVRCFIEDKPTP